ncbi:MAG: radical SAM protein [Candidatus Hydrogenedentales bacterium]|jgi:MoaA/NifB/PqqE/SkfB family radical SAM enzyme
MNQGVSLAIRLAAGVLQPNHPSTLILFVTSRCNCRCSFCFNLENVVGGKKDNELTLDSIRKIAKSMQPLTQMVLSGGEPFLRRDMPEIVEAFYGLAGLRQVSIPTNGALPKRIPGATEQILKACPELIVNVNISLDAIGEEHDRARELPGCFENICETYRLLAAVRERFDRLSINIQTVVMRKNVHAVMDLVEYIKEHFDVNYHSLGLVRGDVGEQEHDYDIAEAEAAVDAHYSKNGGVNKSLPVLASGARGVLSLVRKLQFEAEQKKTRSFECLAGRKLVVISDEGNLLACEPLAFEPVTRGGRDKDDFVIAQLQDFDYDVEKALQSPKALEIKKYIADKRCWCLYGCAMQNSIVYSPKMYPRLAKEIVRQIGHQ